jgi:hypothetical protein
MPETLQLNPQLDEVVDLPVEHNLDRVVLVAHGLRAAVEVDDAQAPMPQRHVAIEVLALAIGSAVPDGRIHTGQHVLRYRLAGPIVDSTDPAHVMMS